MNDGPVEHRDPCPDEVTIQGVVVVRSGWRILDGCDLRLQKGLLHGLVGPGGSGKTTVLKVLATLIRPDSGRVWLFGEEVNHGDKEGLRRLRSRIGMQFQNLALFDFLDVGGNVAFSVLQGPTPPPAESVQKEVASLLRAVGLPGTEHLRLNELSGGMQRRVALARALMGRPALCLHDDPSAGLDPVNSSRIFAWLRTVQKERGVTMVVASHDVDRLARVCDQVHVMRAGRVVYSGTVEGARRARDPEIRAFFLG